MHFYNKFIMFFIFCTSCIIPANNNAKTPTPRNAARLLSNIQNSSTGVAINSTRKSIAVSSKHSAMNYTFPQSPHNSLTIDPAEHPTLERSAIHQALSDCATIEDFKDDNSDNPSMLQRARKSIVECTQAQREIHYKRQSLSATIQEINTNSDSSIAQGTTPSIPWYNKPSILHGICATSIAYSIWSYHHQQPPKRFITGAEPMIASFALSKLLSIANGSIIAIAGIGVLWKIRKIINTLYENDFKKIEQRLQQQINTLAQGADEDIERLDQNIKTLAENNVTIANIVSTLIEALPDSIDKTEKVSVLNQVQADATNVAYNPHASKVSKINKEKATSTKCACCSLQ